MKTIPCPVGAWSCPYHACMSDDCQKQHVISSGADWGQGECKTEGEKGMNEIRLTPEVISAYQELITNPKKNGLPFTSINDYFKVSDTVTAKHILADSYINHIQKDLPKIILYIIMDNIFGQCEFKDANNDLGYYLTPNHEQEEQK